MKHFYKRAMNFCWNGEADFMNYGEVFKKYRELSGITQEKMASALGRQQSFISKIENGYRGIDLVTFIHWAQIVENKEDFLKEMGLLESPSKHVVKEEYQSIFFELVKKEMLLQQHL